MIRFAGALASKLHEAEKKYGYSDGWKADDWMDECRAKLREHTAKGDPRDVAAYCAFLWHHRESTVGQHTGEGQDAQIEAEAERVYGQSEAWHPRKLAFIAGAKFAASSLEHTGEGQVTDEHD